VAHTVQAHQGNAFAIDISGTTVASSGQDGFICILTGDLTAVAHKIDTAPIAQALNLLAPKLFGNSIRVRSTGSNAFTLLLGTATNEIVELQTNGAEVTGHTLLTQGHHGELWGLDCHPTETLVASACDDQTVRVWNYVEDRIVAQRKLPQGARSVGWSPDGSKLCVGFKNGSFMVINSGGAMETLYEGKPREENISETKFSPDGTMIALGSNDNFIDVISAADGNKIATCKGHSSYITHVDWSADNQYLQTDDGAYDHLYWTAADGKQVRKGSSLRDVEWAQFTCILGFPVLGMWPEGADGTDINSVDRSHNNMLLATSDDFSHVNLFRYPCPTDKSAFKQGLGHCSHVTKIRFVKDDSYAISAGGLDAMIMKWRIAPS